MASHLHFQIKIVGRSANVFQLVPGDCPIPDVAQKVEMI